MGVFTNAFGIGVGQGAHVNPFIAEYKAVMAAMTTQPSPQDAIMQNWLMKKLVDLGIYAKAEIINIYQTHAGGQNINWAKPGTFNPLPVNSPVHTPYVGYKGDSGTTKRYINLKFNPTTQATKISKDNICVISGVSSHVAEATYDFGAGDGASFLLLRESNGVSAETYCNQLSAGNKANILPTYVFMSRNSSTTYTGQTATQLDTVTKTSTALINKELYSCGWNNNGVATPSTKNRSCDIICSYLTGHEIQEVISVLEQYARFYNASILVYPTAYPIVESKQQITLNTYVADNNEVIHPSVCNVGKVWNGYQYWQTNTPYPASNNLYEIPEVYGSNDGVNWEVPAGGINPVLAFGNPHWYSDPTLFFENDILYLFFRSTQSGVSKIMVMQSTDGITWNTGSQKVAVPDTVATPLTPSVIKVGGTYYMYCNTGAGLIGRLSCNTIDGTYGNLEACTWGGTTYNHLGAYYENGTYYLAIGAFSVIYILKSTDGIAFTGYPTPVIFKTLDWEIGGGAGFYKPSIVKIGSKVMVYYSVGSATGNWMGMQEIKLL